jgi:hypothetical protein
MSSVWGVEEPHNRGLGLRQSGGKHQRDQEHDPGEGALYPADGW